MSHSCELDFLRRAERASAVGIQDRVQIQMAAGYWKIAVEKEEFGCGGQI